jgi:hypothetical protein
MTPAGRKSMARFRPICLAAFFLMGTTVLVVPARAIDLTGAWSTEAALCAKIFEKQGNRLVFTELADLYGSGFIIENTQIRGKVAQCTIKARKEDGPTLSLTAACATSIMASDVEFSLKAIDDNSMSRRFPGVPGMEIIYHRCRS